MRRQIGADGEDLCAHRLAQRGWIVINSNIQRLNTPNFDLCIERMGKRRFLQVKSSARERGYVTGGSVNPKVVSGARIFNRVSHSQFADFAIFISNLYIDPVFYILPIMKAEEIFRRNVDSYFKSPRLDGGQKSQFGQTDIFVGVDPFPHSRIVPDQRTELDVFRDAWDLLD